MVTKTKRRRPYNVKRDSVFVKYGSLFVAQRNAKQFSNKVQIPIPDRLQKRLWATLSRLYGRFAINGRFAQFR